MRSANLDGTTFDAKRVRFASVALTSGEVQGDGSVVHRSAATTLTDDGSRAFSGFYAPGTRSTRSRSSSAPQAPPAAARAVGSSGPRHRHRCRDGRPALATLSVYQVAPVARSPSAVSASVRRRAASPRSSGPSRRSWRPASRPTPVAPRRPR
ncbi:HtaA domain-containing protein [Oerskovia sp. M15]